MALSIRNKRVEVLARSLAYERGLSITDAILEALESRLQQLGQAPRLARDLACIETSMKRIASLPTLSNATAEEIIGYDQNGLPS